MIIVNNIHFFNLNKMLMKINKNMKQSNIDNFDNLV